MNFYPINPPLHMILGKNYFCKTERFGKSYNHFQKCWDTSRFSLKYCKTSIPLAPFSMLSRNCHIFVLAIDIQTSNSTLNGGGGEGGGQIPGRLIVQRPNVT